MGLAASGLASHSAMADDRVAAVPLASVVRFGAYAEGLPYEDKAFLELEGPKKLGAELELASGFVDWDYLLGEARDLKLADGGRRTLLYSWEPHCDARGQCIAFRDVIAGRADAYLTRVAESMRRFPHDIYVRPWAEMNATWSPYQPASGRARAGSLEEFRAAFRYLHDFFRTRGVTNVKIVFNPDVSEDPENVPVADLWPGYDPMDGHGYVDVLGIDGYNWGDSFIHGSTTWTEFDDLFRRAYGELTALDPNVPVWICEFGTKEPKKNDGTKHSPAPVDLAHDKGAWIEHMMSSTAFPRIRALAYYSAYLPHHDNQRDFRLDSSPSSLDAIRNYLREHQAAQEPPVETAAANNDLGSARSSSDVD
jgi:hypothetical protein